MQNERLTQGYTDKIFERDAYVRDFGATVTNCVKDEKGYLVELDATAFFPEGGGQPSDEGIIDGQKVVEVFTKDGHIYHKVADEIETGKQILGQVDDDIRFRRMQLHSGEHLLCGLIHNAYGYENVGFHMDENQVVLDVNGPLSIEELEVIEERANRVIYENVPITTSYPDEEEASTLEYRSKLELTEGIRLVTIEGYDVCACCAPHVSHTGEIGVIKVVDVMSHRGGTRITMIAGLTAYLDYVKLAKSNGVIMRLLSAKRYETDRFAEDMAEKLRKANQDNVELKKLVTKLTLKDVELELSKREADNIEPFIFFTDGLDNVQLRNMVTSLKARPCNAEFMIIGFNGNDGDGYSYIAAFHQDSDELPLMAKKINELLLGRGGGNKQMIQGSVKASKEKILCEKF